MSKRNIQIYIGLLKIRLYIKSKNVLQFKKIYQKLQKQITYNRILNKGTAVLILFVFITGSIAGCGQNVQTTSVETRQVNNLTENTVNVPVNINAIATAYGPSYESMVVLGQEDKIVICADVQVQTFAWAQKVFRRITSLPVLSNVHAAVNIEELLKYKPDIVFGFPRPNEEKKLGEAKVASVPGKTTTTLADIPEQLKEYANVLGGDSIQKAQQYETYFNQKINYIKSITDKIPDDERPSVYFAGIDLLTTYGKYCDIPELIATAGGKAVTKDLEAGNRTSINFEQLASYNPEYIFIDHGGIDNRDTVEQIKKNTYSDGRYSTIKAVSKQHVYLVPSGTYFWDMGLQKILLLMYIAKIIHPQEFSDLNMVQEVKGFYATFFQYDLTDSDAQKILSRQDP